MLPLHWRTQPVILVADDGRSASIRSRLFQPASSRTRAMGFGGGMYHDQVVLEDGVARQHPDVVAAELLARDRRLGRDHRARAVEELLDCLALALLHPRRVEHVERARRELTWDAAAQAHLELYRELL